MTLGEILNASLPVVLRARDLRRELDTQRKRNAWFLNLTAHDDD